MTALVAAIEARVAELRKVIADATPAPWEVVPSYSRASLQRAERPATSTTRRHPPELLTWSDDGDVLTVPDATAIVTAVNLLPALLDHIERVVQRHTPVDAWTLDYQAATQEERDQAMRGERPADHVYEYVSCGADHESWIEINDCPDLTSAATALGIDPALREDPT